MPKKSPITEMSPTDQITTKTNTHITNQVATEPKTKTTPKVATNPKTKATSKVATKANTHATNQAPTETKTCTPNQASTETKTSTPNQTATETKTSTPNQTGTETKTSTPNQTTTENQPAIIYPTPYKLGWPLGSIKEEKAGFRFISPIAIEHNGVTIQQPSKLFRFDRFKTQQEAKEAAESYRQRHSDNSGQTTNRIRYLDANTIEVKLTQEKTMKTDAELISKVQLYPLQAKKTAREGEYYAYYQDKKKAGSFASLITNYNPVKYINGDTLDLRLCNLTGTVK